MKVFILFSVLLSASIQGFAASSTGFRCVATIAVQSVPKDHYNIEGEQNPPIIHHDYTVDGDKTYYFKIIAEGNYIHGLALTTNAREAVMQLDLKRVEPNLPEAANGVQIVMNTGYAYTFASLGMRDNYDSYAQNITAKLFTGGLGFIELNCLRD